MATHVLELRVGLHTDANRIPSTLNGFSRAAVPVLKLKRCDTVASNDFFDLGTQRSSIL